ncbi:MAG: glycosyltransferase [Flavobacteriaceae bacterium]|nr:glycosyltransferase [Flavobacteriaceae bacterium]
MENVKKKILLLSTGDVNGAYEAIFKLSFFLKSQGFQVAMVVKDKTRADDFVIRYNQTQPQTKSLVVRIFEKIQNKVLSKHKQHKMAFDPKYNFLSTDETSSTISAKILVDQIGFTPDFIFTGMTINFVNSTDLLALQQLTKAQVYNITVDMNHFTGGCHYAWDCDGYIKGCTDKCPAILSQVGKDKAKINFETKLKNAQQGNFKIIAGSGWTLDQSKKSKIYKNQEEFININSLIDTSILNNKSRAYAKEIFNLEKDKFYILMGCQHANDPRKGFEYLLESLKILEKKLTKEEKDKIEVLIVSRKVSESFSEIPFAKKHIDYIKDYRLLSLLYQASDVFVNSSIEDSGPMMVSEALSCGTPVVGFDMGVVTNMVINDYNGYKAILKDSNDLSIGIEKIFKLSEVDYQKYSDNAVKQVEEFSSLNEITKQFYFLYN